MIKNNLIILLAVFIPLILSAEAEKLPDPSWVYLKKAENFLEKGDYANALLEARNAKKKYINEKLDEYFNMLLETQRDKTQYEIKKILEKRRNEMVLSDDYPAYHELLGDIYIVTNFAEEALSEYKIALSQKKFFEYPQRSLEIRYKMAGAYEKLENFELADISYREIVMDLLKTKKDEFWERIRFNIRQDMTLTHAFRIYRLDGVEYLRALYKVGQKAAFIKQYDEALFYLVTAGVVWMTYNSELIKKDDYNFQYAGPVDFIGYSNSREFRVISHQNNQIFDKILFMIGYVMSKKREDKISEHYYKLSLQFGTGTGRRGDLDLLIQYLKNNPMHELSYAEFWD